METPSPRQIPYEDLPEGPLHTWDWPTFLVLTAVHVGALFAFHNFSWSALAIMLALYMVSAMGITLGYHRLLTHRSYKTPRWVEYVLSLCGTTACQGGPVAWVAIHRLHHARADHEGDPHGAHQGFWHSHMGWMLTRPLRKIDPTFRRRFARDLDGDPVHRFFDRSYVLLAVGLGLVLFHLGGWKWVVWGMFVRLVLVYHVTWLVNSAAHRFGYRSHPTRDLSTNCWWVAALAFGEGWHNNHHAFPSSARHGLARWELDPTWWAIRGLEALGLAWEVKVPRPDPSPA